MTLSADTLVITPEFLSLIAEIDEFKGSWKTLGTLASDRLIALRRVATIESIGSSTRIEGSQLSNADVERLLSNLDITTFESRSEKEVAGYAKVLETVFESYKQIDLKENHILQLHRDLLIHSEKDAPHRGKYKTGPNHVSAFDESGQEVGVVFETASPFETPVLMEGLVQSTNDALREGKLHPLLVIGLFIVTLLEIHPFQDGNGRLSRILTNLLLLRAGYAYVPYSSLENVIEKSKNNYYLALRQTQGTIRSETPDWQPWLSYFLNALARQARSLDGKIARENKLRSTLPKLSMRILTLTNEHGTLTLRHMVELTNANRNTIKKHVAGLVDAGQLVQHGVGRGTWYTANLQV